MEECYICWELKKMILPKDSPTYKICKDCFHNKANQNYRDLLGVDLCFKRSSKENKQDKILNEFLKNELSKRLLNWEDV